jgi:hypothetical protein
MNIPPLQLAASPSRIDTLLPGEAFKFAEESANTLSGFWPLTVTDICNIVFIRSKNPPPGMSQVGAISLSEGEVYACGDGSLLVYKGVLPNT